MSNNPLFIQDPALEYDAQDFRRFLGNLFGEGVANPAGGDLLVTQRLLGANMSVDVAAGPAYIQGDTIPDQGVYRAAFPATNVTIEAAPASNSRIDLVVARVYDKQVTGVTMSGRAIEVLRGTVAASPVAPTVPETAIALARVVVAAGATSISSSNITDLRTPVGAGSGVVATSAQPLSTAQIAAITAPRIGQLVANTDTGRLLFWNGTRWAGVAEGSSGSVSVGSVSLPGDNFSPYAYFVGTGFTEIQFTFSSPGVGGFSALAGSTSSLTQFLNSGSAPPSAGDAVRFTAATTASGNQTATVRNVRLEADGFLRMDLGSGSGTSYTTVATTRIVWRVR